MMSSRRDWEGDMLALVSDAWEDVDVLREGIPDALLGAHSLCRFVRPW